MRNNNLVCLSALDKHMVYAPSSESYEFFSELSSLLPALECPKSEPEFIRGFCDCWWQQVRFCRQFQNSQRSPESWSALCCRPFTSFVFGQTVVWHVIQPVSFPLGRDFLSLILKTGSRCLSELDTDPSPYFSFANVLYTTGRTSRLLCWENSCFTIQSNALSLGCRSKDWEKAFMHHIRVWDRPRAFPKQWCNADGYQDHCSDVVLIWMLPHTRHRWLIKIWTTGLLDMVECNHRCRNWFAVPRWLYDLKPFAVIGLTRIYCNQSDEFYLVDVSSQDAPTRVEQLREQGWDIEAEIPVWDSSLKARNDFCVASKNLYDAFMGIYAADHPIVEHQDEDSFDAWLRRKQKEKEEPWDFSAEVESSSL